MYAFIWCHCHIFSGGNSDNYRGNCCLSRKLILKLTTVNFDTNSLEYPVELEPGLCQSVTNYRTYCIVSHATKSDEIEVFVFWNNTIDYVGKYKPPHLILEIGNMNSTIGSWITDRCRIDAISKPKVKAIVSIGMIFYEVIRVARGCTPRTEKKVFGPNLQGKVVSAPSGRECTPAGAEEVSNFLGNWGDVDGGRGYLGSFSMFWGRRLKKVVSFFGKQKCTPQTKSWLCLCMR